jgi:hypothetical protein
MTPEGATRWTRRQALVAAFVVAFALLQLGIPIATLSARGGFLTPPNEPRTGELPFSWQMYTVVLAPPTVIVVWPDGRSDRSLLAPLLGELKARSAYGEDDLRALCARNPGAASVTYESAGTTKTLEC